jgi:NAD(P)-dependent dehydrogenase (short-subunit alcohol dehydrogenase family)
MAVGQTEAGRVALATGAASGIGRAVAARLLGAGMEVLAVDLEPDPDGPGSPLRADLTDPEANERAVAAALERFGRLDVVIAGAGVQHVAPVQEFPLERWQTILALMLTSPFLLAKHAWGALRGGGDGRFIAIASVHGLVASPYKAAYVSAKHGVLVRQLDYPRVTARQPGMWEASRSSWRSRRRCEVRVIRPSRRSSPSRRRSTSTSSRRSRAT